MNMLAVVTGGLLVLAILSGMLGLGVAFAAVPFLSLFMDDLVNQVQPLTLLLNGLTALFATFGFARSRFVDWKRASMLAGVTTLSAPFGAWLAHSIPQNLILVVYFAAVSYLAYSLFRPVQARGDRSPNFPLALGLAVPISMLSGLLGVGPGFLLMPTLILVGFEPKQAAGMNAFAVTPPSFSSLIPHLSGAVWDWSLTVPLLVAGAGGSFLGARITSLYVPGPRLKQIFGVVIVLLTLYKLFTLL